MSILLIWFLCVSLFQTVFICKRINANYLIELLLNGCEICMHINVFELRILWKQIGAFNSDSENYGNRFRVKLMNNHCFVIRLANWHTSNCVCVLLMRVIADDVCAFVSLTQKGNSLDWKCEIYHLMGNDRSAMIDLMGVCVWIEFVCMQLIMRWINLNSLFFRSVVNVKKCSCNNNRSKHSNAMWCCYFVWITRLNNWLEFQVHCAAYALHTTHAFRHMKSYFKFVHKLRWCLAWIFFFSSLFLYPSTTYFCVICCCSLLKLSAISSQRK